mmetsp:Transcript_29000/g.90735  ORF Transcript_29000/g.90735 Transcript_29000/m.90735 type:complete len:203 (-) Transcript_29000:17-625(-)
MRSGRRGAWVGSLTAARGLVWQGAPSKGARARFARWSWSFRWRLVTLPPVKLPSPRRARRARRSCGCERGWRSTAMGRWRVPSACTLWRARARWRRRRTTTTTTTRTATSTAARRATPRRSASLAASSVSAQSVWARAQASRGACLDRESEASGPWACVSGAQWRRPTTTELLNRRVVRLDTRSCVLRGLGMEERCEGGSCY